MSQLHPGENLLLQYDDGNESSPTIRSVIFKSQTEFNNLVHTLDGIDIIGFWAVPSQPSIPQDSRIQLPRSSLPFEDEFPIKTSVHRPVEDLVLGAVSQGSSLDRFLEMKFGRKGFPVSDHICQWRTSPNGYLWNRPTRGAFATDVDEIVA